MSKQCRYLLTTSLMKLFSGAQLGGVLGDQTPALFSKRAKVPFSGANCVKLKHYLSVFSWFLDDQVLKIC